MSEEREELEIETPEEFDEIADKYFGDHDDETDSDLPEEAAEEVDDGEDQVDDDPPAEPDEPAKPDLHELQAKELQRTQQLNATLEKQLAAFQANPTPEGRAKIEKTKSRLDAIVEAGKDVDAYEASVILADEGRKQAAKLEQLEGLLAKSTGASDNQVAMLQRELGRLRFRQDHPQLADRYDDLAREASATVDAQWGDRVKQLDPRDLARLDSIEFGRIVDRELGKLKTDSTKPTDAPPSRDKKPVATKPIKTKSGDSTRSNKTLDQLEDEWVKKFERME